MITVKEAENIIYDNLLKTKKISISINDINNRILQEDIFADRESPPFNRVTMDGIAINFESWKNGNLNFKIQSIQKAGDPNSKLIDSDSCIEVMTGTELPDGCNCVIKVEDLEINNGIAILKENISLTYEQNIHKKGSDYPKDYLLINEGTKLLSTHTGVIASVGKSTVLVAKEPSVAIISTGDELVDLDKDIQPYQIRMSNSYSLQSALKSLNIENVEIFHITDDKILMEEKLRDILKNYDVLILSGGVSMGKFDYIPEILEKLHVKKLFHKVSQKPGKPLWFGVSKNRKPVFALPGNPVSTVICFYRYIVNYLKLSTGYNNSDPNYAVLAKDYVFKPDLTCFLPVKIKNVYGQLNAYPVETNTSGDYGSLINSDGFIELPSGQINFDKGYVAKLYLW